MKKILGFAMIASLPISLFVYLWITEGFLLPLGVFGSTAVVMVFVYKAETLIKSDKTCDKGYNKRSRQWCSKCEHLDGCDF